MAQGGVYRRKGKGEKSARTANWRVRYPDHTGKMVDRTIPNSGAMTKAEAEDIRLRWATKALHEREGTRLRGEHTSLDAFWREVYWPAVESGTVAGRHISESTAQLKWRHYTQHLRPILGTLALTAIGEDTARLLGELTEARAPGRGQKRRPLDPATVWAIDRTLTAILHYAARTGYYGPTAAQAERARRWVKPYTSPERPKPKRRPTIERIEDVGAVIAAALEVPSQRMGGMLFGTAIMLCFALGLRRGELAGMRVDQLTPEHEGGGWRVRIYAPKTDEWTLHYVRGDSAELLSAYLRTRAAFLAEVGAADSPWLFPVMERMKSRGRVVTVPGARRKKHVITDAWWAALKKRCPAQLPAHFRRHDMRGVHIKTLGRVLGMPDVREAARHGSNVTTEGYLRTEGSGATDRAANVWAALPIAPVTEPAPEPSPYDRPKLTRAELLDMLAELDAQEPNTTNTTNEDDDA